MKKEQKKQLLEEVAYFFKEEYDLELGVIGTENILDFFQENYGKIVYNEALDAAKKFYEKRFADMEDDYFLLYKQ